MTDTERYAWLQLALTPYIGAESFLKLIQHFGSAEVALRASANDIQQIVHKGKQAAATWHNTTPARQATDAALAWEQQTDCRIMLLGDADYPTILTEGITPPPILFLRGHTRLLQQPAISVVGSRHASSQAMRIAHGFSQSLSQQGITVISGMAAGIDTAAHTGALIHSGRTIAIWGTGIDRIYPAENRHLAHQIAEEGLIVSEFPLGTRPVAGNFPRRNRLIAAQAYATLVIEATLNSGSLITARLAADMGREVMAIPSNIDNPLAKGCHQLIKEGAKLVECIEDIINECPRLLSLQSSTKPFRQPANLPTNLSTNLSTNISTILSTEAHRDKKPTKTASTKSAPIEKNSSTFIPELHAVDKTVDESVNKIGGEFLKTSAIAILDIMQNEPIHPDLIAEKTLIPTDEIYALLLEWELEGIIVSTSGGRYQRIK